ncbi:GntR family transcriptional regulator [Pasteurellaceae bacterium Pebbles2]|nr:GntR family transcriptional regulator [Pasteurellaceae bacterium Pebbles2]
MAKNLNLRLEIINQLIDDIMSKRLESPLPSQNNLSIFYNVSRTTIRYAIEYLSQIGVLAYRSNLLTILRIPMEHEKKPYIQTKQTNEKNLQQFENYLQLSIQEKRIKPGDELSELELARDAGVDIQTIREYFMQFARFHLVKNLNKGKWQLIKFDQHYADKLFELREMLECHALSCFMELAESDIRWAEMKILYKEHQELRKQIVEQYADFSILDHKLHTLILSAADNPFINDFIELIAVIFHFHYQWDNSNLRTRNILAIEEHLSVLKQILRKDKARAINELKVHLQTAKKTMVLSII